MARFLLVHGTCHGAWCWKHVIPRIESLGHQALAIDLPSHGADPRPIRDVTLESYRDAILEASNSETIVVGHSMAGYPIAAAAERSPDRMARLVFLCAYAPQNGKSLTDMRAEVTRQPLLTALELSRDKLSFTINPAYIKNLFYHDCPPGTLHYAGARLCPEAILPQATRITLSENYETVPKSYIRCTEDHSIPPEHQTMMTSDWQDDDVYEMTTGHSPFFASPEELANLLARIAKKAA